LFCSYRLARGSYRQLYDVVHPELLRISRNQQQYQIEKEEEQRQQRQLLQQALEALDTSNSEIKSLQAKVRKSSGFQF
jgi:hypothetical protein